MKKQLRTDRDRAFHTPIRYRFSTLQYQLLAVLIALLLCLIAFHGVDHAALFPPLGPTKVVGETWITR